MNFLPARVRKPWSVRNFPQFPRYTCADTCHEFWPDDASLLDSRQFQHAHIHGHRQITDLYLLGLAVKHGGRLVTFDANISLSAVHGAKKQHVLAL